MTRHLLLPLTMALACLSAAAQIHNTRSEQADSLDQPAITQATATADSAAAEPLAKKIDRLLADPIFETSQVALVAYDLTADSLLYSRNAHQLMRPASCEKLVTAIAALDCLGGAYRAKTQLMYTGAVAGRTLSGDVWLIGGFDPLFGSDDMQAFVSSIKALGVDTIRGAVVADRSMTEDGHYGAGWCWDDDNPVLTPLLCQRRNIFIDRFLEALASAGIVLDGQTDDGVCPPTAFPLCSRFHTIDQILTLMMKDSDNLFAESLFYQLAAASGNRPAGASDAVALIRRTITRAGLDPQPYMIADGSGLSLYNYLTADLLVRLLRYARANNGIAVHLMPSLPVAGVDGTLRHRMRGALTSGNVRAKTGTVTCVSSLAGYLTAASGHDLCFAIINQGVRNSRRARQFQDAVCETLAEP